MKDNFSAKKVSVKLPKIMTVMTNFLKKKLKLPQKITFDSRVHFRCFFCAISSAKICVPFQGGQNQVENLRRAVLPKFSQNINQTVEKPTKKDKNRKAN